MQNNRTETMLSTYKPKLSIVVYQSGNDYYLESHSINDDGKVMEGKPLLQETIQEMVDVFFDEKRNNANIKGIIPDNLISFNLLPGGNYRMVWYRPAEIRVLHFAKQLKISTGKSWVPAMLYIVDRKSLDVFALKSNSRPVETTKLYRAPYHNVDSGGNVCLGSAQVKKPKNPTYSDLMKYWEDLFWLSEFTHINGQEKVVNTDLGEVWRSLIASKTETKWSDINELIELKKVTLKTVL